MEDTRDDVLDRMLIIMKNLNLILVLYISMTMFFCLRGMIEEQSAAELLGEISSLPIEPWKIPAISVLLYICCLLLMKMECTGADLIVKVAAEIIIGAGVCYMLSFSYTGLILLIVADTMRYFPSSRRRIMVAVTVCLVYLLVDYDLISALSDIISLDVFLEYFRTDVRSAMLGAKNVLSSLNTFVFLFYMILQVQRQMSEKERILSLNEQLNSANDELREANERLELYMKDSVKNAETRERNRLAREIHDTLGHALTGIMTGIEACIAIVDISPEVTKQQLRMIEDVARNGMTDVRRSVKALRPDALERLDLGEALVQVIDEMRQATKTEIIYECDTELDGFNEDEEDVVYRIVQECITNAMRHGKATKIVIRIDREYQTLRINVHDNGTGCKDIKKGFGLHHMEERLSFLGGTLSYNGDDGFEVEAHIPIRWGNGS